MDLSQKNISDIVRVVAHAVFMVLMFWEAEVWNTITCIM